MKNTFIRTLCTLIFSAMMALGLAACDNTPRLDAKSPASMEQSMRAIVESLNADEAMQLQQDMGVISMDLIYSMAAGADIEEIGETMASAEKAAAKLFDGKSADDIKKMADKIRAKND